MVKKKYFQGGRDEQGCERLNMEEGTKKKNNGRAKKIMQNKRIRDEKEKMGPQ